MQNNKKSVWEGVIVGMMVGMMVGAWEGARTVEDKNGTRKNKKNE